MDIFTVIIVVFAFTIPIWAYREGVKVGLSVKNKEEISPIKIPFKPKAKLDNKQSEFLEGLNNILNYDGNDQSKEGE